MGTRFRAPWRLQASHIGLLALLLLSTNAALALRWSLRGKSQLRRSFTVDDGILREVLSPESTLHPGLSSTHATPMKDVVSLSSTDVLGAQDNSFADPGLATVVSRNAALRLPRLAEGPSIQLEPKQEPRQQQQQYSQVFGSTATAGQGGMSQAVGERHPRDVGDFPSTNSPLAVGAADPSLAEFHLEEARTAGRLASIAYCSHPDLLQAWNCTRCAEVPGFVPHRVVYDAVWDLAAYVGYYAPWNAVVLAFRGTDSSNWGQWAENMRAWRTDTMFPIPGFPHALIHSGFYTLWTGSTLQTTFTAAVSELLEQHASSAPRLVATGHSMGGALAQLAGLELKLSYNRTHTTVYTYGAPRVGNVAYQQLFNSFVDVSWRLTHNRDIVPSVPLQLMGFQHVAREVWEVDIEGPTHGSSSSRSSSSGNDDPPVEHKLLLCDDSGEDPSCHNSACYLGLCTSIADHLLYLGLHMYQDDDEC